MRQHLVLWENGELDEEEDEERLGRCIQLKEIINLEFDDIATFYLPPEQDEQEETDAEENTEPAG